MNCTIHIDGGSRGNPGPAAAGVVIVEADRQQILHEAGYFLGTTTNNVAEYQGLLHALDLAGQIGVLHAQIHSDSELLVKQILGQYRVKSADLQPLFEQAQQRLLKLDQWQITHVRREKNQRADELANLAMDARRDVVVIDATGQAASSEPAPAGAEAAQQERPEASPTVCWTVELTGRKSKCLVGQATGNAYTFGPTTPEGFCVYAAAAMFADSPAQWPARRRTGKTHCQQCAQPIEMRRIT